MNKNTLIAALVRTANELDILGMHAEADAVTRVSYNLSKAIRTAQNDPGSAAYHNGTAYNNGGFNDDDYYNQDLDAVGSHSNDFLDGMSGAQRDGGNIGLGGVGSSNNSEDVQMRMTEIQEEITQLFRSLHSESDPEYVEYAEQKASKLADELRELSTESGYDINGGGGEQDPQDDYGVSDMDSEPIFHGQKRVPYSDDLAGGHGARLFN